MNSARSLDMLNPARPVVGTALASCCTVLSVLGVAILCVLGLAFDSGARVLLDSIKSPHDGHAVAQNCYTAAMVCTSRSRRRDRADAVPDAAFIAFCTCQVRAAAPGLAGGASGPLTILRSDSTSATSAVRCASSELSLGLGSRPVVTLHMYTALSTPLVRCQLFPAHSSRTRCFDHWEMKFRRQLGFIQNVGRDAEAPAGPAAAPRARAVGARLRLCPA